MRVFLRANVTVPPHPGRNISHPRIINPPMYLQFQGNREENGDPLDGTATHGAQSPTPGTPFAGACVGVREASYTRGAGITSNLIEVEPAWTRQWCSGLWWRKQGLYLYGRVQEFGWCLTAIHYDIRYSYSTIEWCVKKFRIIWTIFREFRMED